MRYVIIFLHWGKADQLIGDVNAVFTSYSICNLTCNINNAGTHLCAF